MSLAALLAGASAVQTETKAQDTDPVMDRQLVMQQLDGNSKALGRVLAGLEPADKLALYARAVANDAVEVRASFQSKTPGGSSKPEVWSNWEDFSKRLDEFALKSDQMAKVAESGSVAAVNELVVEAMPCRSCHLAYRARKTG